MLKRIFVLFIIMQRASAINDSSVEWIDAKWFQPKPIPQSQIQLVMALQGAWHIRTMTIMNLMKKVDRKKFVLYTPYYYDQSQDLAPGSTSSAPHTQAFALETLETYLTKGKKALDVGSGNGYLTVCMAELVGETGKVVGIEHSPKVLNHSRKAINKHNPELLKTGRIKLYLGDGRKGLPEEAPYDAIYVGAQATDVPPALLEQLKKGGIMMIPIANQTAKAYKIVVIEKLPNGTLVQEEEYGDKEPLEFLSDLDKAS